MNLRNLGFFSRLFLVATCLCFGGANAFIPKFPGTMATNGDYHNPRVGIHIDPSPGWARFDGPKNAPAFLKNSFDVLAASGIEPLFLGVKENGAIMSRLMVEDLKSTTWELEAYFTLLTNVFAASLRFDRAVFYTNGSASCVFWEYGISESEGPFHFYEVITLSKNFAVRYSFWSIEAAFPKFAAEFEKELVKLRFTARPPSSSAPFASYVGPRSAAQVPRETPKGLFWRAAKSGGGDPLYLLGSTHWADQSFYPLSPKIMEAFEKSIWVGVEVNIKAPANARQIQNLIRENAKYPDGSSLADHVAPSTWSNLGRFYKKSGLALDTYKNYQPWFHSLMIDASLLKSFGLSEEMGVENHFLSRIKSGQTIRELETMEAQAVLMTNWMNSEAYLRHELEDTGKSLTSIGD
ncbi:MAG: TraB/GumN family protein, partial [Spirochaetia bacterium]|nr:TraB/GumN family protein [Spirochaetia bacterium]